MDKKMPKNIYLVSAPVRQKFATSVMPQITPVPEGATFEEKYMTLLKDYENLQYESEHLELCMRRMKHIVHMKVLKIQTANGQIQTANDQIQTVNNQNQTANDQIQTANNQIQDQYKEIQHILVEIDFGISH